MEQNRISPQEADEWDEEIDLSRYFNALLSRKWLVLLLTILFGLVAVVMVKDLPPVYEATTTIIIDEEQDQIVEFKDIVEEQREKTSTVVGTQLGVISSRDVLIGVVEQLGLAKRTERETAQTEEDLISQAKDMVQSWISEYTGLLTEVETAVPGNALERALSRLRRNLSIRAVRGSELVRISFRSPNRELAAAVPNTVAAVYIDSSLTSRRERMSRASEWLSAQVQELEERVKNAESDLREFLSKQSLSYFESLPEVASNPVIQRLRDAESELELRISELSARYGPEHPTMVAARSDLEDVTTKLQEELRALSRRLIQSYAGTAVSEADQLIGGGLRDSKLESRIREVATSKQLYNDIVDRLREVQLMRELETAGARVVDHAAVPLNPQGPGKRYIVLGMALLGGLLGVAAAIVLEWLNKSLRTTHDVEQRLHLPVLSVMPLLSSKYKNTSRKDMAAFLKDGPRSFLESAKSLRTAIVLSEVDHEGCTVVLVTSSVKGEGKTTISCSLASAFADLGKKTLLVDADMRLPTVRTVLNLSGTEGLSEVTANAATLEASLRPGVLGLADVLPSGEIPPNPLELLSSKRFEALISTLRGHYDFIVIDSAPTLSVSDSLVLSQLSDGVLFVVRSDSTAYPVARSGIKKLKQGKARIYGIVLGHVDISKMSKYGKYSYYGDYYGTYGVKS